MLSQSELKEASQLLASVGIERPEKEIEKIRAHSNDNPDKFHEIIERRMKREPLERIFGTITFFDLEFKVRDNVFKPGFETETTMEYGLLFLEKKEGPLKILDLGTGNGCILLSLLHRLPNATGIGIDCNMAALELAEENALMHGLSDRVMFRARNWMEDIHDGPFDLIISNPPRIPTKAIPHLVREVSLYDPKESLDGTSDGLEFYRRTARAFPNLAQPDGKCILQVGEIIATKALEIFKKAGYSNAEIKRDYKSSPNCIMFGKDPETLPGLGARFIGALRSLLK